MRYVKMAAAAVLLVLVFATCAFGASLAEFEKVEYGERFYSESGDLATVRKYGYFIPADKAPKDSSELDDMITSVEYFDRQIENMPKETVELYNRIGGKILFAKDTYDQRLNTPALGLYWYAGDRKGDINVCTNTSCGDLETDLNSSAAIFAHEIGHFVLFSVRDRFTEQDEADLKTVVDRYGKSHLRDAGYQESEYTDEVFAEIYAEMYGKCYTKSHIEPSPETLRLLDRAHEIEREILAEKEAENAAP